ncbi:MAG TPA: hypothetical protein VGQ00_03120 [Candidatus Norongarragalinales archaeon]|nr:hypothetical protein [Candidatus Norongarragalinales archaeon]
MRNDADAQRQAQQKQQQSKAHVEAGKSLQENSPPLTQEWFSHSKRPTTKMPLLNAREDEQSVEATWLVKISELARCAKPTMP